MVLSTKQKTILLVTILFCFVTPAYPSWIEHAKTQYIDLDGDFIDEIIIESKHGAGTGHCIEDMRIFKDKYPELELIFTIRTLDSYFDSIYGPGKYWDIVSEVEFTEPDLEIGTRNITVKPKKIYYKDENKFVEKEEELETKVYKWNGVKFEQENE